MPADYAELLKDLDEREAKLLAELNAVRTAKPAVQMIMRAREAERSIYAPKGKYVGVGATAAIRDLFQGTSELLTREEIFNRLKAEGWTNDSTSPQLGIISATLSQMKDSVLEKVEDRWRKRVNGVAQALMDAPSATPEERAWEAGLIRASASASARPSVPWPSAELGPEPSPSRLP